MVQQNVIADLHILAALPIVALNVHQMMIVLNIWLVFLKSVEILVQAHVVQMQNVVLLTIGHLVNVCLAILEMLSPIVTWNQNESLLELNMSTRATVSILILCKRFKGNINYF